MARKLDDVMAALPKARQQRVEARAMELATLKDLRLAAQQTQEQLATALGVGQAPFPAWKSVVTCCSLPCATTYKAWAASWSSWPSFPTDRQW